MANLKDLKNRIASVKSTRQITQAMQMVAAAKLRRAQEAAENARPYTERMEAVIASLASAVAGSEGAPRLLAGRGRDATHLVVVMTAERGLCGGFNSAIVRRARTMIAELEGQGKTIKILTVGKKGREQLRRQHGAKFVDHVDLSEVRRIGYANARAIADDVMGRFDAGEFDVATIVFNTFKNVMTQVPTTRQIIPADFEETESETGMVHAYEPSEEVILRDLLPQGVTTQIFAALLENAASEQGARMTAMDSATRNADQMIDDLTIQYNRTRQAVITNELIEIISGAEAL